MKIESVIPDYIKHLKTLGRAVNTLKNVRHALRRLTGFLAEEAITDVEELTFDVLSEYQEEVAFYITKRGKLMEIESQAKLLSLVKGFTRFLRDRDYLITDPGAKIKLPKLPKRLPKVILSPADIKTLVNAQDTKTGIGYRNLMVLEILYDTAIRRFEVTHIKLTDLDLDSGYIRIRGKGDKDRVVPLSTRVCGLIQNYLLFVRPEFIIEPDQGYVFIGRSGGKMNVCTIGDIVDACVKRAGIKKKISTHTFRHACASHMLKNGAPIRHIQELLGHASIETTQIYTRVTINDLKEIHSKYHPSCTSQE